jgi:hypothetical protein
MMGSIVSLKAYAEAAAAAAAVAVAVSVAALITLKATLYYCPSLLLLVPASTMPSPPEPINLIS